MPDTLSVPGDPGASPIPARIRAAAHPPRRWLFDYAQAAVVALIFAGDQVVGHVRPDAWAVIGARIARVAGILLASASAAAVLTLLVGASVAEVRAASGRQASRRALIGS